MRVAALYDIHGNLPALRAVLEEIRREGVEQIVVGGDVIPGPMPRETLRYLLDLDIPVQFIRGNGEREVLARMAGVETGSVPERFREVVRWVAEQVQPEYEAVIASWPETLRVVLGDAGEALFCHATPHSDSQIFTRLTPEERLLSIFAGASAPLVICGHTHMQFDRLIGKTRVVNAGSVGMPFGEPGADWLLLGPDIQLQHTAYDLEKAAAQVRATKYPGAEDFAAGNILRPPSEADTLESFTRVEVQ